MARSSPKEVTRSAGTARTPSSVAARHPDEGQTPAPHQASASVGGHLQVCWRFSAQQGLSHGTPGLRLGFLLLLLITTSAMSRRCKKKVDGRGNVDFDKSEHGTPQFPVHLPAQHHQALDFYSKGSLGTLELEAYSDAADGFATSSTGPRVKGRPEDGTSRPLWFAAGSNCRPWLHCPLWVPLAVVVMDRAASMSVLLWMASLDGRPRRRAAGVFEPAAGERPTLRELWDSLAEAFYSGLSAGLMRWIGPEYAAIGLNPRQGRNVSARMLMPNHHRGIRGWRIYLPPHLCFTCCTLGLTRLRVVFVRNPFARLVSFFRMSWQGNKLKAHNRWEDFPAFVRYISDGSQSPDLEGRLKYLLFGQQGIRVGALLELLPCRLHIVMGGDNTPQARHCSEFVGLSTAPQPMTSPTTTCCTPGRCRSG
mmetsp:Transcript_68582/g.222234  ORF Transcript_68582/g.222234 Transcript_68582/m.222234 type:complete len:422 (-) Transcript_68582:358-1623(-)